MLTNSLWTAFELSTDRFHTTKAGKTKEAGKGGKVAETVLLSRNHALGSYRSAGRNHRRASQPRAYLWMVTHRARATW